MVGLLSIIRKAKRKERSMRILMVYVGLSINSPTDLVIDTLPFMPLHAYAAA